MKSALHAVTSLKKFNKIINRGTGKKTPRIIVDSVQGFPISDRTATCSTNRESDAADCDMSCFLNYDDDKFKN